MRCFYAFAALVAALLVGGCGGSGTPSRPAQPPTPKLLRGPESCTPKEGAGVPGVCVPKRLGARPTLYLHGPFVPDVSYYQGHPNWAVAKREISGAIARVADGGFNDPAFAYNWRELRRLHIWHAAYYFLRPYNCIAQADRAVGLITAQGGLDSGPLIADVEVPLNAGCAEAFVGRVERDTGLPGVIYTAPGTWAGGGHGNALLWVASYGPSPGCVWTCSHVAWQYTDGVIGPLPHCIAGIGCDDISRDEGITRLGAAPPKPKPSRRALETRIRVLHRELASHGCNRRVRRHERTGPVCKRWKREGDRRHHELGR